MARFHTNIAVKRASSEILDCCNLGLCVRMLRTLSLLGGILLFVLFSFCFSSSMRNAIKCHGQKQILK